MLIETMINNWLIPVALHRTATENDSEQEADPPGDQDTSRDDRNNGEAFDREQAVVEHKQR